MFTLQNAYMIALFVNFGSKSLYGGEKFIYNINENSHSPQVDKFFFPNLYKLYNFYILIDFYLVLLKKVLWIHCM